MFRRILLWFRTVNSSCNQSYCSDEVYLLILSSLIATRARGWSGTTSHWTWRVMHVFVYQQKRLDGLLCTICCWDNQMTISLFVHQLSLWHQKPCLCTTRFFISLHHLQYFICFLFLSAFHINRYKLSLSCSPYSWSHLGKKNAVSVLLNQAMQQYGIYDSLKLKIKVSYLHASLLVWYAHRSPTTIF